MTEYERLLYRDIRPDTFAPITAMCEKQGCASHASTESEIVAAECAIRTEGLQVLTFWEHVTQLLNPDGVPTTTTNITGASLLI